MWQSLEDFTEQYMAMSSAKIFIGEDTIGGKSLIYKIKGNGFRIEPCETPDRTGDHSEEQPLMITRCCLVVRNEENYCSIEL